MASSAILPLRNLLAFSTSCASTISIPPHFSSPSPPPSLFPSCCTRSTPPFPSPPLMLDFRASGRLVLLRALAQGESEQLEDAPPSPPLPNNLPMHFKAEGTLSESAAPRVVKALEYLMQAIEGVSDVSVTISEGIATVELLRLTNIQATGASSGLIEVIQSQGFKLQNLSIVFDDDGKDDVYDYDYATSE